MKLFDISKLRLETFHKVLHFIVTNLNKNEPTYKQSNADMAIISSREMQLLREQAEREEESAAFGNG